MNIEIVENLVMLIAGVIGLLSSLFHYIEKPKRGWLLLTIFFLAHILSDYYWTLYTLVMQENPDVSAFMAYFGWNVGYVFLLLAVLKMRQGPAKRYFHPLMLLPIPLNIIQFIIYLPFGGIVNNIWQETLTTISAVLCLQSILYYLKNRRKGAHFPHLHLLVLLFIAAEYSMWTSSCYFDSTDLTNPYYYFAFASYFVMIFFAWAVGRDYEAEGEVIPEKTSAEMRFQMALRVLASAIIIGGCIGGYMVAQWMKDSIPGGIEDDSVHYFIAVTLFVISIILVVLILGVLSVITYRYRSFEARPAAKSGEVRRRRYGAVFVLLITLGLMVFSVGYTSNLFYQVSVAGVNNSGEDTAELVATELKHYLSDATSTLQVTADSVEFMLQNEESQEKILAYLTNQTEKEFVFFGENLTGLYGYIRGEYMDGSGWVPPGDYNLKERDWYLEALRGGGSTVIVPPYVDAQTHSVVITICRLLQENTPYNGENVVALDMIVNYIQEIIERADINGKGHGLIVNRDGLIVAHKDPSFVGTSFTELAGQPLLDDLIDMEYGTLQGEMEGEQSTLFVSRILNQWYVVITVPESELLSDVRSQMTISILVSVIIFALISFFYYLGYKSEQTYSKQLEEMRIGQKQKEYEAEVLRLEKKTSDAANKAKSSFLADMSHEIRTPINTILGMNEMILREADKEELLEYARNIDASGRSLLQLINSILDFSKIEDGKMEIVPVRYAVSTMVTYLENSVSERARKKGLEFTIWVDPEIPSELYGDEARINQIIVNLLTNAVKYTHEGSVNLRIEKRDKKNGSVLLYVEVRDTGIGIREEDREKLFESFERLDMVKNRNIEGTGLGMSITTNLLSLMDSSLTVESVYGVGSSFSFLLWQKIEEETPVGEYRQTVLPAEESALTTEYLYAPDAHILVVDDTKMNLSVVCNLLKRTGIQIDTASDGEEAIALAEKSCYDVILMDQRMPGMDGTETLQRIRGLDSQKNAETPVICLTADAIRGARERYMAEGFTDYLTKPVTGRELEHALCTYLPKELLRTRKEEKPVKKKEKEPENKETASLLSALEEAGLDTGEGMTYCMEDEETYREILKEYVSDYASRRESLTAYYEQRDWKNYLVFAHSLKGTSRVIGATRLTEAAAALEAAAHEENGGYIEEEHEKTMKLYEELVAVLQRLL